MVSLELETRRLRLSPLTLDDIDIALDLFTDEAVTRFVCALHSPDEVRASMADSVRRGGNGGIGIWCVRRADNDEKIGSAVLLPLPEESDDTDWSLVAPGVIPEVDIEIGYLLKPAAWGHGYATEIARALIRFAFEETPLTEVVAVTDPDNHASRRVLAKAGMREEGQRRAYASWCSAFRLGREEWQAAEAARSPSNATSGG